MDYLQLKNDNKQLNYKEIKEGKLVLKSRPLFFWFDICGMCNLQCKHCLFHMQGRTSNEDVSDRIYDIVMSELMPTAYKCNLGGTNLGESTISKKFSRFIKDCSKYKVKINLTTNGIYLNDQWLPELLENLEVIGFSMEGFDEEYEKIRGKKWSEFIANNKKIIAGKKAAKNNFQIEWRYCAHADNIHQLPEMIRIAHDIGIDRIQVMNLVPYMKEQKYKNLFYHRSSANKYFDEARKVATKLKFNINIPKNFDTGTFELTNKKIKTALQKL
ncbi:radical SAM protein [bacterium]|nr:radical SAM protein [bacterium]